MLGRRVLVAALLALGVLAPGVALAKEKEPKVCHPVEMQIDDMIHTTGVVHIVDHPDQEFFPEIREPDLPWLAVRFGVTSVSDLTGKTFTAPCGPKSAGDKLSLLAMQGMYNGIYLPPPVEVVYRRIVESLAAMQQPDFSDIDVTTIKLAVRAFPHGKGGMRGFMERLITDVEEAGAGRVKARRGTLKEFKFFGDCGESCDGYLVLTAGDTVLHVRISPIDYLAPVRFDLEEPELVGPEQTEP